MTVINGLKYRTSTDLFADAGISKCSGVYELFGPDKKYFPDMSIRRMDRDLINTQTRLVQRIHDKQDRRGFRNFWQLSSFWFDQKPFMIVSEAGPEGVAHFELIVTDPKLHETVLRFIRGFYYAVEGSIKTPLRNPLLCTDASFYQTIIDDSERLKLADYMLHGPYGK